MDKPAWIQDLRKEDLFDLFRKQLGKDFEQTGFDVSFTENLPKDFELLKQCISDELAGIDKQGSSLMNLLYRIDIPESTLKHLPAAGEGFYTALAELVIKRVLQKVILKKRFSK